jgi:hypothetical protein
MTGELGEAVGDQRLRKERIHFPTPSELMAASFGIPLLKLVYH